MAKLKKRTSPCRRLKGIMKYIMTQNQLNEKSLSNETTRNMFQFTYVTEYQWRHLAWQGFYLVEWAIQDF